MSENAIGPSKAERAGGVKMDAMSAAVMASMTDATQGMATAEELRQEADASKPRPKANLDANDIKDVYTHDNLLGVDMMKHIPVMDWTQTIKDNKEIVVRSRHVAHRIKKEGSNIENLKVLRYMLLLINIYNKAGPAKGGSRVWPKPDILKNVLDGMPEAVVESARRRFTDGGKMMPRFKLDLLITHVCALACLVDYYEVNVFDLQEDLKLEGRAMAKYFREIGARVRPMSETERKKEKVDKAAAAQMQIARLKLPLEFPKVSAVRKKTR
jgi:DNA-directed RNA polymerase I subunit RPA49